MKSEVLQKIAQFVRKRDELLDEMESLDNKTLYAVPIEGKWSIIEIVEHLVNAEKEVLMGMPEYRQLSEIDRSVKSRLMYRVVMFILNSPIKVKTPSRKMNPVGGVTIPELRERWDKSQQWFKGYVEQLENDELDKPVFLHPVAGGLSVNQAIDMSIVHIDRHTDQIRKRLDLLEK